MKFAPDPGDPQRAHRSVVAMTTRNYLSHRAATRRLGIHRSTLRAWNECGVGPLPDEHGRHDTVAVTEWADEMAAAFVAIECH